MLSLNRLSEEVSNLMDEIQKIRIKIEECADRASLLEHKLKQLQKEEDASVS